MKSTIKNIAMAAMAAFAGCASAGETSEEDDYIFRCGSKNTSVDCRAWKYGTKPFEIAKIAQGSPRAR